MTRPSRAATDGRVNPRIRSGTAMTFFAAALQRFWYQRAQIGWDEIRPDHEMIMAPATVPVQLPRLLHRNSASASGPWREQPRVRPCRRSRSARNVGSACKPLNGRRSHDLTREHVAFPVDVADHSALSERPAASEHGIGLIGRNFREDERPGPADSCMPARIRPVAPQVCFLARCADQLAVHA